MDEGDWTSGKRTGDWIWYDVEGNVRKTHTFR